MMIESKKNKPKKKLKSLGILGVKHIYHQCPYCGKTVDVEIKKDDGKRNREWTL